MKSRMSVFLVAAAIVCSLLALDLQAEDRFVDPHNPTGLPDITQADQPICAAATSANFMWDLSDAHRVGTQPLVDHPPSQNPAQNWPATWGNWSADSLALRDSLAHLIYQEPSNFLWWQVGAGNGVEGGIEKYLANRGYKYSRGVFGGGNTGGLSVRSYNKGKATYQTLYSLVIGNNQIIDENVAAHVFWHNADGSVVMKDGEKTRHSLGVAGVDTANQHIYFTNGWQTEQNLADPVSRCYYDRYDNIIIDNSGGNNPDNKFRIPAGAAINPAPAGCPQQQGQGPGGHPNSNNDLVRGLGNDSANSDYVEMYEIVVVKPGGSPEVGLVVNPSGYENEFRYRVYNPEVDPMEHFFLEVGSDVLSNGLSLSHITPPPGWAVEFWNPAGMSTDRVSPLNPTGAPDDGRDLFGPPFAVQGGGENPHWRPKWGGLHFYWTGQPGTKPIETDAILDFSLYLSSYAFGVDPGRLLLTVVGQESNEIDYFSVIGGPVALPRQPATLTLHSNEDLNRFGNRFLVGLQIFNDGGSQARNVTVTSVEVSPTKYIGSTLPVNLGPAAADGAVYMTLQADVTGLPTGTDVSFSVQGAFDDTNGETVSFNGVITVPLIAPDSHVSR